MLHKSADDPLGAFDLVEAVMRLAEEFSQPFPSTNGPGEVELVKNGEFFSWWKMEMSLNEILSICMSRYKAPRTEETRTK